MALVAVLVAAEWLVAGPVNAAHAAGSPGPGYAVTDFATGFGCAFYLCIGPVGVTFGPTGDLYVTDYPDGQLFKFDSSGGVADSAHLLNSSLGTGAAGVAFSKDGQHLYLAQQWQHQVFEYHLDTNTTTPVGPSLDSPTGLVVDPLSGDLFTGAGGVLWRISNPQDGAAATAAVYASVGVDGLTFAPDGTLYAAGNGNIYRIEGTGSPNAGQWAPIANVPFADGIALVAPPAGSRITQLAVNTNFGTITLVDFSVQPVTYTDIVTGGSRGDFVAVGPDKCLYATQSDEIQKVTAADGSCPFLPTGVSQPTTSCKDAGQMVNNTPLDYHEWSLNYGISACEGLVISNVSLDGRAMAERMSLPYLVLKTCTSADNANCGTYTTRHITLQSDSVEPQSPDAYTRVHLLGLFNPYEVFSPAAYPCSSLFACNHEVVSAMYQVDLTPAPATGPPSTWLSITQRYEFYRPFKESLLPQIACEPSQYAPLVGSVLVKPLPECGRWKPIVTYTFHDSTNSTLLVSLNAAARLHYTPDALAVRAGMLARDCDPSAPPDNCDPTGHLDVYLGQDAIQQEVAARVLAAFAATSPAQPGTIPGRYDNVHQTPSSFVQGPLPLPPGCAECVHMHWRWGTQTGAPPFFGSGQPLIGDAIPAAQPNPLSHQNLDVGLVAYHSEELSPYNFLDLITSNTAGLNFGISPTNHFTGGVVGGQETLRYPTGSCASRGDLTSWGQCGEVVWLSATTVSIVAHDEDQDTFFAFGGFFCGQCIGSEYAGSIMGLVPKYKENQHASNSMTFAAGSAMTISFTGLFSGKQVNDVLPPGLTGISAAYTQTDLQGHPTGPATKCSVTPDAKSRQVVTCDLPLVLDVKFDITITGTFTDAAPGTYSNVVHAIWGSPTDNDPIGGNYKKADTITIV